MHPERSIRVLVVDDHAGVRLGISSLIDAEMPQMQAVGSAATASDALAQTLLRQPDVVVLDVNLNGEDGLSLIPAMQRAASCEVVVLTSLSDPHVALHAYRMGARACLHKAAPAHELLNAIRESMSLAALSATPVNTGVDLSYAVGTKGP